MIEWQNAIVVDIIQESPGIKRFFLQVEGTDSFAFVPGQFITLDLPIHEKKSKRMRSYSIASAADGENIIELIISIHPLGAGTNYLFNEINIGDKLVFRGPQGVFTLPASIEQPILFICTGTGIAPFRSMLKQLYANNSEHITHLVFGCRTKEDILYYYEMKNMELQHTGFHYHVALSRLDSIEEGFNKGYVHYIYEELLTTIPNPLIYLCGWREMIDEANQRLLQAGIDKKNIHFELYG